MLNRTCRLGALAFAIATLPSNASAQVVPYVFGSPPTTYNYAPPTPDPEATPYVVKERGVFKIYNGIVGSYHGYQLRFIDGRRIYLSNETIIEPVGTTIRRGMQISVHGYFRDGGGITARQIVIMDGDGLAH